MRDYTYNLGQFSADARANCVTKGKLTIHYQKSLPVWKLVKLLDLVALYYPNRNNPNVEWCESGIIITTGVPLATTLTDELYDLRSSWKPDFGLEVSFLPTGYGADAPMNIEMGREVILLKRREEPNEVHHGADFIDN